MFLSREKKNHWSSQMADDACNAEKISKEKKRERQQRGKDAKVQREIWNQRCAGVSPSLAWLVGWGASHFRSEPSTQEYVLFPHLLDQLDTPICLLRGVVPRDEPLPVAKVSGAFVLSGVKVGLTLTLQAPQIPEALGKLPFLHLHD